MALRQLGIAFAVVVSLTMVGQKADAVPAPTVVAASTATGAGVVGAGAFIGLVAVICGYDLYLKITGLKNWDGTPKTVAGKKRNR